MELVLLSGQQCDGDDGISCHYGHPAGPGQVKHLTCPSHPTPTTTLGGMDSYCHLTAKEMKFGSSEPITGLVTHLTDSSHYPLLSVLMVQMLLSKILPGQGLAQWFSWPGRDRWAPGASGRDFPACSVPLRQMAEAPDREEPSQVPSSMPANEALWYSQIITLI